MDSVTTPPDLPIDAVYTSCYCEENIYKLCEDFASRPTISNNWSIWAVFISNTDKKVRFHGYSRPGHYACLDPMHLGSFGRRDRVPAGHLDDLPGSCPSYRLHRGQPFCPLMLYLSSTRHIS